MKQAATIAALLCIAILAVYQTPKNKGIAVKDGALNTAPASATEQKQQHAASPPSEVITVYNQNPSTEGKSAADQNKEEIEINRQAAKFTAYLVAVGFLQCAILFIQAILFYRQTKIMGQHKVSLEELATAAGANARAIETQAGIMNSQLASMNGQIAAIESQNRTLEESVAVARSAAEAGIEKERARLKIGIEPFTLQIGLNQAVCWVENYGETPAFISDFRANLLYCLPREIEPDYSMCKQILYDESVQPKTRIDKLFLIPMEPNEPLKEDDVRKVQNGDAFVHFYGFVKYRDVFKRNRKATIHMLWAMRWGGMMTGQIMQWWEPVGTPEQNADE